MRRFVNTIVIIVWLLTIFFVEDVFTQKKEQLFLGPTPNSVTFFRTFKGVLSEPQENLIINSLEQQEKLTNELKVFRIGAIGSDLTYHAVLGHPVDLDSRIDRMIKYSDILGLRMQYEKALTKYKNFDINNKSFASDLSELLNETNVDLLSHKNYVYAAILTTGSWLETIYITATLASEQVSLEAINKLGELKHTVEQLRRLLEQHKRKNKIVKQLYNEVLSLESVYNEVSIYYEYKTPTVSVQHKTTTVETIAHVTISLETVEEILDHVKQVRSKYY